MNDFRMYPQVVIWEITFACNMRCIHCGTSAGKVRPGELTTQEALDLIEELHELGTESITLSGGEPLLRKDWPVLARRIRDRGMQSYLITNGMLVDEATVAEMKGVGFGNVGISLDGTEPTHNHIRQDPRSFERVMNAMHLMDEADLRFCAITQVSNLNLGELDDIRRILIDAHCPVWRVQMTTATGRMSKDMVLSLDNYPKLVDKLIEYRRTNGIEVDVGENVGYFGCKGTELLGGMPYLGCYAGTRVAGIESNGNVKGCLSMPEQFVEGNLRESSFTQIWNDPEAFLYNRQFTRETAEGPCRECHYLPLCRGGCTTTSVSATGARANNPYCMHRIEQEQGIMAEDPEIISSLLNEIYEAERKLQE